MNSERRQRKLEGPGSEARLRAMQARFRAVTPKPSWFNLRRLHLWLLPGLIGAVLGMAAYLLIDLL